MFAKFIAIALITMTFLGGLASAQAAEEGFFVPDAVYLNALEPYAGGEEEPTLDERLDLMMPEQWSMSFGLSDEKASAHEPAGVERGLQDEGDFRFGIGLTYEFSY